MDRQIIRNENGSVTLIEDGARQDLPTSATSDQIDQACVDFFTPVDIDGNPLTGLALTWHRSAPDWLKNVTGISPAA